jgi:hypothetical protein
MRRRVRFVIALALAAPAVLVLALPVRATPAQTVASGGFAANAAADAVRTIYVVKDAPASDRVVDVGQPAASAKVDTLGSNGLAAAPDPGDTALSGPGLVRGATSSPVPPDDPLVAQSSDPVAPQSEVNAGPFLLRAASTPTTSAAYAFSGAAQSDGASGGSATATANAAHDPVTGATHAEATTTAEAMTFASGTLRIGRVFSRALVTQEVGQDLQRSSELTVESMTILGQRVELTPGGLIFPGSTTPLPDGSPLLAALHDHSIDVHYLAPRDTDDGVVAGGIEIVVTHPTPSGAPATVTYRFGQAAASGTAGLFVPASGVASTPLGGVDTGTPPSPGRSSAVAPSAPVVAQPTTTRPSPSTGPAVTPAVAIPQWARVWLLVFYAVLVLGAFAAFVGSQIFRLVAVRLPWTS